MRPTIARCLGAPDINASNRAIIARLQPIRTISNGAAGVVHRPRGATRELPVVDIVIRKGRGVEFATFKVLVLIPQFAPGAVVEQARVIGPVKTSGMTCRSTTAVCPDDTVDVPEPPGAVWKKKSTAVAERKICVKPGWPPTAIWPVEVPGSFDVKVTLTLQDEFAARVEPQVLV
jgi:hypothetical protein